MQINMDNYAKASYDVFSMFNERWALVTAGSPDNFNTMTISWGAMGTVWGGPGGNSHYIQVFVRDCRRTADFMLHNEYFTVSFFPKEYKKDLLTLGSISGHDEADKLRHTALTPKPVGESTGFEQAQLTFLCKKMYCQMMDRASIPPLVIESMYTEEENLHYIFFGSICGVEGEI